MGRGGGLVTDPLQAARVRCRRGILHPARDALVRFYDGAVRQATTASLAAQICEAAPVTAHRQCVCVLRGQVTVGSCAYLSHAVGYPSERHAMGDPPVVPLRFEL